MFIWKTIFKLSIVFLFISCTRQTNTTPDISIEINIPEQQVIEVQHLIDNDLHNNIPILDIPYTILKNIWIDFATYHDDNIISNAVIEYYPESGVIRNISEIDNYNIMGILDRPILNWNVEFFRYGSNVNNILTQFGINISTEDLYDLNNMPLYNPFRVSFDVIDLNFFRSISEIHWLSVIQYNSNSDVYEFNLKIGTSKIEILEYFGEPTYYTNDGNIFIYPFFGTLRQLNVIFENDIVTKVQIIAYDGE